MAVRHNSIMAVIVLLISGCAHTASSEWAPVGWIDEETYIVEACGIDQDKETSPIEARTKARQNALNEARSIALEKFIGERINAGCNPGREYVVRELGPVIKRGEVVRELWDGNTTCAIRYRIHEKGLRKKLLRMSGEMSIIP